MTKEEDYEELTLNELLESGLSLEDIDDMLEEDEDKFKDADIIIKQTMKGKN